MNSTKLAPALLLIPFALTTLACPTRPIDSSGSGGGEAGAAGGIGGRAGATAGEGGAAGSSAGGSATAGVAGAAGGMAGSIGGVAGAAGDAAGVAGSLAGAAGGIAGAAGGTAGAAGGASGTAGGTAGRGGDLEDGQPCSLATNCASHVCTGFYVDVDGDGYGTGQATGFCGTTAPVGYAFQSGDCCDNGTNLAIAKLIHPGADYQTSSAGGVCGVIWDYDCSGTIEQSRPHVSYCGPYPSCANMFDTFPDSDCGQSVTFDDCKMNDSSATCYVMTGPSVTMGCK
jgi:hypothetical protein